MMSKNFIIIKRRKRLNFLGIKLSWHEYKLCKIIRYAVPWHEQFIEDLICEMNDNIENKIFCELCTYNHYEMPRRLLQLNASRIDCVDPWNNEEGEIQKGIYSYKNPIYATTLQDKTYDCVYGIALLEHIEKINEFAKELYRILKPNGIAIVQGASFWTCDWGHHITPALLLKENGDNCTIEYPEDIQNCGYYVNNTLSNWGHLYMSKDEQIKDLTSKGIPYNHAEFIIDRVQNTVYLSRQKPSTIINAFADAGFKISAKVDIENPISDEIYKKLSKDISRLDANIRGLKLCLKK